MTMVILGLGSNIGNRQAYLDAAIAALGTVVSGLRRSRLYESAALLPAGAPPEWDIPFFNMAVAGECALPAQALMKEIKAVERTLGRQDRGRWAPREIDIDILALDGEVIDSETLCVPHRELLNREFALLPLVDLAPDWAYPGPGECHGRLARDIAVAKGWA